MCCTFGFLLVMMGLLCCKRQRSSRVQASAPAVAVADPKDSEEVEVPDEKRFCSALDLNTSVRDPIHEDERGGNESAEFESTVATGPGAAGADVTPSRSGDSILSGQSSYRGADMDSDPLSELNCGPRGSARVLYDHRLAAHQESGAVQMADLSSSRPQLDSGFDSLQDGGRLPSLQSYRPSDPTKVVGVDAPTSVLSSTPAPDPCNLAPGRAKAGDRTAIPRSMSMEFESKLTPSNSVESQKMSTSLSFPQSSPIGRGGAEGSFTRQAPWKSRLPRSQEARRLPKPAEKDSGIDLDGDVGGPVGSQHQGQVSTIRMGAGMNRAMSREFIFERDEKEPILLADGSKADVPEGIVAGSRTSSLHASHFSEQEVHDELKKRRAEEEEKERIRQERIQAEEKERVRQERIQAEEKERIRQERVQAEEKERVRQERIQAEEKERVRQERIQAEEKERVRQERFQAEEKERVRQERIQAEEKERVRQERIQAEEKERIRHERIQAEKKERIRQERVQAEEKERMRQERIQAEEKERIRQERVHAEEKERVRQERIQAEEKERIKQERVQAEEKERVRQERIQAEEKQRVRQERIQAEEKERIRQERVQAEEKERVRQERIQAEEKQRVRQERIQAEEKERIRQERVQAEEKERVRQERIQAEEKERIRQERVQAEEKERVRQERIQAEEKQRVRQERIQAEEKERIRQERIQAEEKERIKQERIQTEEKERVRQERIQAEEKERTRHERIQAEEKQRVRQERIQAEEKERIRQERIQAEEKERVRQERIQAEEKERVRQERIQAEEKERIRQERIQAEEKENKRIKQERIQAEEKEKGVRQERLRAVLAQQQQDQDHSAQPQPPRPGHAELGGAAQTTGVQGRTEKFPHHTQEDPILFYEKGEPYYEFTNFYQCRVTINEEDWPTTENYFQAQKYIGTPLYPRIRSLLHAREAFTVSRSQPGQVWRRKDWLSVNVDVMRVALWAKFTQNPKLKQLLLETGDRQIVEHTARDKFWGDGGDGSSGKNMLGVLLMELRTQLQPRREEELIETAV